MEGEREEWQRKYDPRGLRLGMVSRDDFIDFNDKKYFEFISERVEQFEAHTSERLPEDFRKYLLYCGHLFYNWSCCGIELSGWNAQDQKDETPFCLWCNQPLATTKCTAVNVFNGTDLDRDCQPGLVRFSHEGCGFFKFIIVKGPLKGTIWSGNPNGDGPYLSRDDESIKELLDRIYKNE